MTNLFDRGDGDRPGVNLAGLADRRQFLALAGGTTLSLALAACGSGSPGGGTSAAGGASTLVMGTTGSPTGFDDCFHISPGTYDVFGAVHETLLGFRLVPDDKTPSILREDSSVDPAREFGWSVEPRLAERWEISDDGRTITYFLRQGVTSQFGNELTAEDVKYTYDRKFALGAIGTFYTGVLQLADKDAVRVEGRYAVSFTTKNPQPLWIPTAPNLYLFIHDSKQLRSVATKGDPWSKEWLTNNAAGFGPYKLAGVRRGQQTRLVAHDGYYGEQPPVKTVILREVPSDATRTALLLGGALTAARDLQPLQLERIANTKGFHVDGVTGTPMAFIVLNNAVAPFDDVRVRRAMNFAFPRDAVVEQVYQGYAEPLKTCMPAIYPSATEEFFVYDTDLSKARALLEEAGVSGLRTTLTYDETVPQFQQIATLYRTALAELGIELTLNALPTSRFSELLSGREQPMILNRENPFAPDPGYATYLFFHKDSPINYARFVNDRASALITEGLQTVDLEKRDDLYREVQRIVMDEAPFVFVAAPSATFPARDQLSGWTYRLANQPSFQDMKVAA